MTFVVTENCQDCRFTDCVTVCPVDCFYGDEKMLYIHPDECIDCGACEPECPVEAIYDESNIPIDKVKWTIVNQEKTKFCQNISQKEDSLDSANKKKEDLGY